MGGGGDSDDRRQQRRTGFHVRPDWLWSAYDSEWVGDGFGGLCIILVSGFLGACVMASPKEPRLPRWFVVYVAFVFGAAISFLVVYPIALWLRALHTRHRAVCFLYEAALTAEPAQAVVDTDDVALLLVLLEWRFAMRLERYQHLRPPSVLALCKAVLLCPDVVDAVRFPHREGAPAQCLRIDCSSVGARSPPEGQVSRLLTCIRDAVSVIPR